MILNFKIQGKVLTKINTPQVTSNSIDTDKCKFYADRKTWENKDMFVVFKNNIGYSTIVSLGKYQDVLSCTVPKRIQSSKYYQIYVYAKHSFKTNQISITTKQGTCTTQKYKNTMSDILSKLDTKIDNIIFEDNQLKCYSNKKLVDTIYIDNVDEALMKELIQDHFEEFYEQIAQQLQEYVKRENINFSNGIIYFE